MTPGPGGRLLVSVDHPFAVHAIQRQDGQRTNYFDTYHWVDEWTMGGETVRLGFWNRPLQAMTDAFTGNGFRIAVVREPLPLPAARDVDASIYRALTVSPSFLFFVLERA